MNALLAGDPDDRQRRSLTRLEDFVAQAPRRRAEDLLSSIDGYGTAIRLDVVARTDVAPTGRPADWV
jgi:hypothetical protein